MSGIVRVNFIVEGQTEETFVRDLLREALGLRGIFISVRRVETGRKHGHAHRGGMTTYFKAKRDIQRWLKEDRSAYVTTMFDCYGLPHDFPNYDAAKKLIDSYQKALYPGYDKTGFGPRIAQRIGLETLRKECRHFNEWLKKLEALPIN
jgi:hypothetical protein